MPSPRTTSTVSVIIPVRDDAGFLRECLQALAAQTVAPLEIIVVDNASSDATADVAREFGARVITQRELGIPISSATGYDAARGSILARLDSDSVPHERWVETVVEILDAHPEAVAVTGSGVLTDPDGEEHHGFGSVYFGWYFALVRLALAHEAMFGSAMALRRWAWQRITDDVCRHDARVHDDMDLSMHLPPQAVILRDERLTLEVSARPGDSVTSMAQRVWRGFYTLGVHYPRELPPIRWLRADRVHGRRLFSVPPLSRFSKNPLVNGAATRREAGEHVGAASTRGAGRISDSTAA